MSESVLTGFKDLQDENSINKIHIPDFFKKSGILLLLMKYRIVLPYQDNHNTSKTPCQRTSFSLCVRLTVGWVKDIVIIVMNFIYSRTVILPVLYISLMNFSFTDMTFMKTRLVLLEMIFKRKDSLR